jgi:hypothetical protein
MSEKKAFIVAGVLMMFIFVGGSLLMHTLYALSYSEVSVGCVAMGDTTCAQDAVTAGNLPLEWPGDYLPVVVFGALFGVALFAIGLMPDDAESRRAETVYTRPQTMHEHIGTNYGYMLSQRDDEPFGVSETS